ncbi:hypothetical protein V1525DRAFT_382438 [Lipomyces kononenkoae]|uniref:Uncharacterized protein n=1 Tax=Lipomyces kononenkoae TaxID=34357 RepID=A0ACC3SV02_LIPKO
MPSGEGQPLLSQSNLRHSQEVMGNSDRQSLRSVSSETSDVANELRKNLYSTRSSIIAQVGVIAFFLYIFYRIMVNDIIFFTGHPALNTFAIFALTQSIILVQPTSTAAEKQLGATVHGIFNLFAGSAFFGALSIIYINKAAHQGIHFKSAHARLGLVTYIILFANVLLGITQYWTPYVYGSVNRAKSLYKFHRVIGYVSLVFSFLTAAVSTTTDYNKTIFGLRFSVLFGLIIVTSIGLAVRIRPQKFQFKFRRS